ncbi:MAG: hypothetical protein JJU00_11290 [Opitutales bacterium]|nr:hypothetical protein [Opitutales bacterium]
MSLVSAAFATGLTGAFAARVFLPVFAAAMLLRFGPEYIASDRLTAMLYHLGVPFDGAPTWFTHDISLWIFGSLAALEMLAHKSAEARQILNEVDQYAKPVAAGLTWLGVTSAADFTFLEDILGPQAALTGYHEANLTIVIILGLLMLGTYVVATGHNAVIRGFIEGDEGDDSGIMRLFSWIQDLWSVFGLFLLILYPFFMLGWILVGTGVILLLRRRARIREERARVPCGACGEPVYRSALACGHCGRENPTVNNLGWLGTANPELAGDRVQHALLLQTHRRCRKCATRLGKRTPDQACPVCETRPFETREAVAAYERFVGNRQAPVILICAALSTIPLFGLLPGVIYYRLALVAPYRRYMGAGRALLSRWLVRILAFFLILLQIIPGAGIIAVPLLALVSHSVYRRAFLRSAERLHSVPS